ncbi:MAG: GTP-binding protein, partial [Megasphaera micronuciformis]|nr:GTP-binding protein [Megasphaera micronuciformis]
IKTHGHLCACGCGPDGHDHHCHEHEEVPFQTLTIRVDACRTEAEWEETLKRSLEAEPNILRVKGIVKVPSGYATVQYSGQHIDISGTVEADTVMTFIGTSLSEEDLRPLWSY